MPLKKSFKCFNKFDVHLLIISNIRRWGQVFKAQNYVFYFESDIAKGFPFRPTCSSYDSERKKNQKVSQKGPEMKVNKCDKLGLTAWGDLKEIFCVIYLELPFFNTTKPYER
jgi:hypothetical protein